MKGIVFNLLEELVRRDQGEDAWDELLEVADLHGAYTSLGSYPDEEMLKLVAEISSSRQLTANEVIRWFGRHSLPLLAEKYPKFFEPHHTTRPFLLTLNTIIHPEVRKIYPGADVPVFDFDTSDEDALIIGYHSARKMCAFAEGLIEGAAAHFGEKVELTQPKCMLCGDEKCDIKVVIRKKEA